jgi:hypothetical protein
MRPKFWIADLRKIISPGNIKSIIKDGRIRKFVLGILILLRKSGLLLLTIHMMVILQNQEFWPFSEGIALFYGTRRRNRECC